jgi:hypothetical protein
VHIKRAHGGIGEPIQSGNLTQSVNPDLPGSKGIPAEDMKPPGSYNRYNRPYTNHASKSSKGNEDIIDKMYQTVIEQQEKERKLNTIMEFYRRYPDAPRPIPIPNVGSTNFPIKKVLEQSLPKISCQNQQPKNNPSPQMQGQKALLTYLTYTRHKIASQNTGANSPLVALPSRNRDTDPRSIQPMPMNYGDDGDGYSGSRIVKIDDVDDWGFKVTMTLKYNCLGDIMDALSS